MKPRKPMKLPAGTSHEPYNHKSNITSLIALIHKLRAKPKAEFRILKI